MWGTTDERHDIQQTLSESSNCEQLLCNPTRRITFHNHNIQEQDYMHMLRVLHDSYGDRQDSRV